MTKLSLIFTLLFPIVCAAQLGSTLHCGYDFTTYLVVDIKDAVYKKPIKGLQVYVIDANGNQVINTNNQHSFLNADQPLFFSENYKTDGKHWFFPYAEQSYLLVLSNTFNAENFKLKIEDIDGADNSGNFEPQIIDLYNFNLYVLCASENARAMQFGRRINNQPIEVFLNETK